MSDSVFKIEEFLKNRFKFSRKPKKPYNVYKKLVDLYNIDQEKGLKWINELPSLGYWKDYMFLLVHCQKEKCISLEEYIYRKLGTKLKKDYENMKKNKKFSYLAKWVPREKSSFNKKLNFINKIKPFLFPNIENNNVYKKKYRNLVVELNKKLDVTEIKLCSKENDKIDFNNVSALCMKNNMSNFIKNEDSRKLLSNHYFSKYVKMDFFSFFKIVCHKNLNVIQRENLQNIFKMNHQDYCRQIKKLCGFNLASFDVAIDTNKEIYEKYKYVYVGIGSLVNLYKGAIINNSANPSQINCVGFNIFDHRDTILNNLSFSKSFDLNKIKALTKKRKLLIMSSKDIKLSMDINKNIYQWKIKDSPLVVQKDFNKINGMNKGPEFISRKELIEKKVQRISPDKHSYWEYFYSMPLLIASALFII
jgi:hypothetical protein